MPDNVAGWSPGACVIRDSLRPGPGQAFKQSRWRGGRLHADRSRPDRSRRSSWAGGAGWLRRPGCGERAGQTQHSTAGQTQHSTAGARVGGPCESGRSAGTPPTRPLAPVRRRPCPGPVAQAQRGSVLVSATTVGEGGGSMTRRPRRRRPRRRTAPYGPGSRAAMARAQR